MRPVLIVGKGPSARRVEASACYDVAALNGAVRLCEGVRWLFVNDHEALGEITDADLSRVHTLVMPSELHIRCGRDTVPSTRAAERALACGVRRVSLYELPTRRVPRPDLPSFGRLLSVAETAVCWCLREGRREYWTLGIDPEGGYSEAFRGGPQVPKPASHFVRNWLAVAKRVRAAGGSLVRLL